MANAQAELSTTMNNIAKKHGLSSIHVLRCFMYDNEVVISGSNALLAFHFDLLQPGDLDLYAPIARESTIGAFLEERGYLRVYGPMQSAYTADNASVVRIDKYARQGEFIDAVYVKGKPIQVVTKFHSTLVMNYIAWYGAVSLYPALTLEGKGIMNASSARADECRTKYELKGFQFVRRLPRGLADKPLHNCRQYFACPSTVRSIHDNSVMFIPFTGLSNTLAAYEGNLVWRLNNNTCGETGPGFVVNDMNEISKYLLSSLQINIANRLQV